jgi:hypothetical protein
MSANTHPVTDSVDIVDVRGPRFVAWVTTAVLIATLLVATVSVPAAAAIVGVQTTVFIVGAVLGPRRHPYGRAFAKFIAPRIGPVTEREPVAPLRFAQAVGFVFAAAATAGFAFGAPLVGIVATAFALFAAFLNAAFGICLGCQIYPFVARMRRALPATT